MYEKIGRGVIFNEMWHDYSITTQPQYGKDRIVNKSNIALYDALKAKFKTHDIYCPDPYDLQNKLIMMAQGSYTWQIEDHTIEFNLDLSGLEPENLCEYTGGMGLRINNTGQKIQQVFIDDKEHFAFNDHVVILPNLTQPKTKIKVVLGNESIRIPHLSFVSKRMPVIEKTGEIISMKVLTKSRAKFTFITGPGSILLNADGYEWGRGGANELKGYVTSDRTVQLKPLKKQGLMVTYADVVISTITEIENEMELHLLGNTDSGKLINLKSEDEIKSARINDQSINVTRNGSKYELKFILQSDVNKLILTFK
jgi:hypothetical protein